MLKIIIAGGRDFNDYELLTKVVNYMLSKQLPKNIEIVSGGAKGADYLGERYAKDNNYKLTIFPADWNKHGKQAGFIRNEEMANYSDCLIAFWDNESKGTKHMINLAIEKKLKLKIVKY